MSVPPPPLTLLFMAHRKIITTSILPVIIAAPIVAWATYDLVLHLYERVRGHKKLAAYSDLYFKKKFKQFFPKRLTEPGSHYMTTLFGQDTFVKINGFKKTHNTVLDTIFVDKIEIRLLPCIPIVLSMELDSERVDDDHIETTMVSCKFRFGFGSEPTVMTFGHNGVYLRGFMVEDEPHVDIQVAPYVGCQIHQKHFEELRLRTGKVPNLGYMEFNSKDMLLNRHNIPSIAAALKEELAVVNFEPWIKPICLGGDGDNEAQFLQEEYDAAIDIVKPAGKILPSILDKESVNIAFNKSSEVITVVERIEKYSTRPEKPIDDVYYDYLNEFLQFVVPDDCAHTLAPDDTDTVLDRQSRPTQLLDYLETVNNVWDTYAQDSTFQKREIYPPKIPAARNIVNPPPQKRVAVGRFCGPLTNLMKERSLKHIYGFGPSDYVQKCFDRVQILNEEFPEKGKFLTDFTKLDATVTDFFRHLELSVAKRAYKEEFLEELTEVYTSQFANPHPKMGKGTRVNLKRTRRSGEGWTSLGNTLVNAFVQYCALRQAGHSVRLSRRYLGACGGDDGMMVAMLTKEQLIDTAADLNLIIKVEEVGFLDAYSFLGIVRLNPRMQLYTCDPARFVAKCAYSHVKNVPWQELAYRKCEPYARMYSNVPLVGNFAKATIRLLDTSGYKTHKRFDDLCRGMNGFIMTLIDGEQFPGPKSEEDYALVEDYVAKTLSLSLGQLREVNRLYNEAASFEDYPTGFVQYKDISSLIDVPYECLLRDLYIPGREPLKLANHLPTKALEVSGCTKSANGKEKASDEQEDSSISSSTSNASSECSSISEAKKKRRKKKRPASSQA